MLDLSILTFTIAKSTTVLMINKMIRVRVVVRVTNNDAFISNHLTLVFVNIHIFVISLI